MYIVTKLLTSCNLFIHCLVEQSNCKLKYAHEIGALCSDIPVVVQLMPHVPWSEEDLNRPPKVEFINKFKSIITSYKVQCVIQLSAASVLHQGEYQRRMVTPKQKYLVSKQGSNICRNRNQPPTSNSSVWDFLKSVEKESARKRDRCDTLANQRQKMEVVNMELLGKFKQVAPLRDCSTTYDCDSDDSSSSSRMVNFFTITELNDMVDDAAPSLSEDWLSQTESISSSYSCEEQRSVSSLSDDFSEGGTVRLGRDMWEFLAKVNHLSTCQKSRTEHLRELAKNRRKAEEEQASKAFSEKDALSRSPSKSKDGFGDATNSSDRTISTVVEDSSLESNVDVSSSKKSSSSWVLFPSEKFGFVDEIMRRGAKVS